MSIKRRFLFLVLAIGIIFPAAAQVTISGPTCVIPGTTYMYTMQGITTTSAISICVSGGVVADAGLNCISGTGITYFKVNWSGGISNGSLTVNSSSGDASLETSITFPLTGGLLDSSSKIQFLDTLTAPAQILCSAATGGSCTAPTSYQWQQSDDDEIWLDIDNATGQNLSIAGPLKHNTFYRRKVSEAGTTTYSDIALVIIIYN